MMKRIMGIILAVAVLAASTAFADSAVDVIMNTGDTPGVGGGPAMPGGGAPDFGGSGGSFDFSGFTGGSFTMPGGGYGSGSDASGFGGGGFTPPGGASSAAPDSAQAAEENEAADPSAEAESTEAPETAASAEQPAGTGTLAASGSPDRGGERPEMPAVLPEWADSGPGRIPRNPGSGSADAPRCWQRRCRSSGKPGRITAEETVWIRAAAKFAAASCFARKTGYNVGRTFAGRGYIWR